MSTLITLLIIDLVLIILVIYVIKLRLPNKPINGGTIYISFNEDEQSLYFCTNFSPEELSEHTEILVDIKHDR